MWPSWIASYLSETPVVYLGKRCAARLRCLLRSLLRRRSRLVPDSLPPLPEPAKVRRRQATVSVVVILGVVMVVLRISSRLAPRLGKCGVACLYLIRSCAFLALLCLERIHRSDPGVITRSPKTCLPIPVVVEDRLRTGQPLDDLRNVYHHRNRRSHGESYCVRCLVWRPPRCHHCKICQRCVADFNHHCSFYGTCIAGTTWMSGNMLYFKALNFLGYTSASLVTVLLIAAFTGIHS